MSEADYTMRTHKPLSEIAEEERVRRAHEAYKAGLTVMRMALHKHNVTDWDAASPETRQLVTEEVLEIAASLGLTAPEEEES